MKSQSVNKAKNNVVYYKCEGYKLYEAEIKIEITNDSLKVLLSATFINLNRFFKDKNIIMRKLNILIMN